MLTNLIVLLCLYQAVLSVSEQKGFLVTAPSTLLTSSSENVCVSLHNSTSPVEVSLSLIGSFSSQLLVTSSFTVSSAGCLELLVPETEERMARLVVRLQSTDSQLSGNSELTVELLSEPLVVLVSTDKPQYKAGQEVCFRVFSLTHRLKPHNGKIHSIWIETPSGIRVEQWRNVEVMSHGLVELRFSLDKDPLLGLWKIKVKHNSSKVVEEGFWVKEYMPASFEVMVHTPTEILPDSANVTWDICAKYSYGEIVQGDAHVEIRLQGSRVVDQPSINHAVKLNRHTGCVALTVGGSVLGLSDPLAHPSAVQVIATVTEKGTGVSHSASTVSPIHNQLFHLHFQCSQYFKPGLPYKGNVVMKTVDGRPRPKVGEKVQVCVKVRHRGQLATKLLHCGDYTTDFSSHVVFALPDIEDPLQVQLITLVATAPDYPTKLYPDSSEVMMLQPSVTLHVKPWFSPSHSYLDVWTRTTLACASTHLVPVYYTVPSVDAATPLFYYLVEGRGDLLTLRSVVPTEETPAHSRTGSVVRTWKLSLQVTPEMSPDSRLTVYYVRADGEVVAASTNLVVDRCFQNKVRVRWEEPQVSPRGRTQLCVRASPHSVCGVTVVDRQLLFNSSQIRTDTESIWKLLNRFQLHKPLRDQRLYCLQKSPKDDESPPNYDLRKKRSMTMPPQDYSDHVDAITAFDDLGVAVMSNLVLETRPCTRPVYSLEMRRSSWRYQNRIDDYSPVVVDNLVLITQNEQKSNAVDGTLQSLIRDYFPDTWIWSLVYVGKEGEVTLNSSAPDTITSWDTRVTCVSEREGLGVAHPTFLSVFRPFFVHVETPFSLKRGENVAVKVIVYNYMHHPLPIVLKFGNNEKLHISPEKDVRFCLQELSPHSHVMTISARAAGTVNLTVQAQIEHMFECGPPDLQTASDTVIKQLLVKNDGYIQQQSQSAIVCPTVDSESVTWDLQLPEADNLVLDSARLQFTVVADLFGPALKNLDSLVLLPMGCGEQNLARLAPNLFVLKYMEAMGHTDNQLRATALKNIKKGYQRQLTFQRSDGSFSAFGEKDESGSMWLTAAVVKTLGEARAVIDVDQDKLQSSVVWITRQQLENGCFPTVGQVFHTNNQGKEAEEPLTAALSALVVANLAASGLSLPSSLSSNAEFCLASGLDSSNPHTLALTTLALTRLGLRQRAEQALQNLMRYAITENDVIHWGKPDASVSDNIVMTSYAVLSLVELGGSQNLLTAQKAVRWISVHRNENGGFVSTQDTVVALEALTKYMTALPVVNNTELVVLLTGDQLTKSFRLSDNNKLVQQQLITSEIPSSLTTTVVGDGCAFIQGVLKYNVKRVEAGSQLDLQLSTATVSTVDPCSVQELRLCAATISPAQTTGMALLTILLVTGYHPDRALLRQLSHPNIKKWEEEDDQIAFYLSEVNSVPICFTLHMVRQFEVEDPLPAVATLIDYYHPEISTSKSYSMQCISVVPLDEPIMLLDSPEPSTDRFDSFHNVNFELETPSGIEGPKPVYACPPNSTLPNCQS